MKEDYDDYRKEKLIKEAENKKSLKKMDRKLSMKTHLPTKFTDENGSNIINRQEMEKHIQTFYNGLFKSKSFSIPPTLNLKMSQIF